ncbi:hypothetical protein EWM64_g1513 [Hericium alpestre]|uniref:Cytochrome P450 n=1 Tax=Hericium alpestre TaxID=135208 RepID=A0A4Z0AAE0_9AGAM|nr:hypothetical protein EWM64_g1513 [Hericium alpestre]
MIDLMGWDWNTAMIPYSERWRMHRRMLNQNFRAKAALEFRPRQASNAADLVRRLSEDPKDFVQHIRTFAASVSMAIAYGHEVTSTSDHLVDIADRAFAMLSGAVFPGVMAVNTLPFPAPRNDLQNTESWFQETGCAPASLATMLMRANEVNSTGNAHDEAAKEVSAIAYAAGADTTVSALSTAILALLLHPEVQQRAQREIDSTVGRERLPSFDDRAELPYVSAVCKEVLRWQVVANLGVPRASLADDVYEGMFIPKGTQIFPNVWAMLHDSEKYPEPEAFKPERFLTPEGKLNNDNVDAAFGFGRRAKDEQGNDVPVDIVYSNGMVRGGVMLAGMTKLGDTTHEEQRASSGISTLQDYLRGVA